MAGMTYPQFRPEIESTPLTDAELDALEAALAALPQALNVEALDGYVSALLLGAQALAELPGERWLPGVWGGEENANFASAKQRKRLVLWVLRHTADVAAQLRAAASSPDAWQPLLSVAQGEAGREWVDARDWCAGFLLGAAVSPEDWETAFEQEPRAQWLAPLGWLGGEAAAQADVEAVDSASREALDGLLLLIAARFGDDPLAINGESVL